MNKRSSKTVIAVIVALALFVVGCAARVPAQGSSTSSGYPKNADGYADITVEQLARMLENKDFVLVNTHTPFEGDLPQTDLSIPYNEIAQHLDKLPDKNAPIVLYCRSGSMSTSAAKELVKLGYTHLMELDGGMNAWRGAGYELVGR